MAGAGAGDRAALSDRFNEYGDSVQERLRGQGLRVELDDRGESIGRKVRDAELRRIPYMLVVGEREQREGTVSVREPGPGDTGGAAPWTSSAQRLVAHVRRRASSASPRWSVARGGTHSCSPPGWWVQLEGGIG